MRVETPAGAFHVGGMAKGAGMIEPMHGHDARLRDDRRRVAPAAARSARSREVGAATRSTPSPSTASARPTTRVVAARQRRERRRGRRARRLRRAGRRARPRCAASWRSDRARRRGRDQARRGHASPAPRPSRRRAQAARTIANSPLVKTAVHGGDPNWGRLVAVAGRAGVPFDLDRARVDDRPDRALPATASRSTRRRRRRRST